MKARIDVDKIAKGLGAVRRGRVIAPGGYFGAMQLVADLEARFRIPKGGGRPTVPEWTTKRVLPLSEGTLKRLERLAKKIGETKQVHLEPMQVAALLLERAIAKITEDDAGRLLDRRSK
jgi:hypothetical protein